MKKAFAIFAIAALAVVVYPADSGATGNGAPSGAHYNLNIIGVPKNKTANMTGNSGHRIFVPLEGSTKIMLSVGDFQVLDANGTDGSASFRLPVADATNSGTTSYSVFIRALGGKGKGSATMVLCGVDEFGEEVCSNSDLNLNNNTRPSKFTNVTGYLLYLYDVWIDTDGDGVGDVHYNRIPLFSDLLQDYFWGYDNNGLKLAQLRFYNCSTTVGETTPEVVSTSCN